MTEPPGLPGARRRLRPRPAPRGRPPWAVRRQVASALAAAFLDGPWSAPELAARGGDALAISPFRLRAVERDVLTAYREPPADRRRELATFIGTLPALTRLWRRGLPPTVVRLRLPTARMATARWPVPAIDTVGELADWLGISVRHLEWYSDVKSLERKARPALAHYDRRWTHSRRGRVRLLESPRPQLKAMQRRLLHEVVDLVPVHDAAHGFVTGRSVHTFAAPHAGRDVVLRLDLTAFFASIGAGRVFGSLRSMGYPEPVAHVLTGLMTTVLPLRDQRAAPSALRDEDIDERRDLLRTLARPHLPQGAPTSPGLANLVAYRLDARLSGLAEAMGAAYTRYADDMAFSLDGPDAARRGRRLIQTASGVIRAEGFVVNQAKTRLSAQGQQQRLCGVVVNDVAGVPRTDRDALRALLHNCLEHGPESQNRDGVPDFRAHLLGRIAWVSSVNAAQGQRLQEQLDRISW